MQGAAAGDRGLTDEELKSVYLNSLETIFSFDRELKMLEDIENGDDNSYETSPEKQLAEKFMQQRKVGSMVEAAVLREAYRYFNGLNSTINKERFVNFVQKMLLRNS